MNLDTSSWRGFTIARLFDKLVRGKANQTKLEEGTDLFYVGAKRDDNGVMLHCARDKELVSPGNCVVFICNGQGSVGYANYMDVEFVASTDLVLGYADWLNPKIGLFLSTVFSLERPKYSFGRKWSRFLKETVVDLPIKRNDIGEPIIDSTKKYSAKGYIPDWRYMEDFIQGLHHKSITTKNRPVVGSLDTRGWQFFLLKNISSIDMGSKLDFSAMSTEEPEVNFVGRSADNNGVMGQIDKIEGLNPYPAGALTVALGGSLGSTFLQDQPFYTSQNVSVVQFDNEIVSPHARLFVASMIQFESQYKYFPFGRELNKYIRTIYGFDLPIRRDEEGEPIIDPAESYHAEGYIPDWKFMEDYMRSLPYGDRIQDLDSGSYAVVGD